MWASRLSVLQLVGSPYLWQANYRPTHTKLKKLKALEDNGIVSYLEEALKSKLEGFEGQERASKLFSMSSISKDKTRKQLGGEIVYVLGKSYPTADSSPWLTITSRLLLAPLGKNDTYRACVEAKKSSIKVFHEGGDFGKVWNQNYLQLKIHIKLVQEKPPIDDLELEIVIMKYLVKEFQEMMLENGGNYVNKDERIQSQFLNFLTTTCGTKPNHRMKVKEEGIGKELSIGFEDTSLNFDIDHMLKCSSSCAYLEKKLMVIIARIKPSCLDLELLHDYLFLDLLVANFSSSCLSMLSKIHIFLGSFVESGYNERVSCFPLSLCSDFSY
ncbi:hypothetical protein M9H77_02564 [Catharanthus roseus]|uniref:Uncharacterized protein n=1 Tax=Catharanthus roseus TaxID=4058 RepID=A0ACC0C8S0_CATRO|nr:hypothetical protein M9H77_02564 [Catharanthus roseus]